jgi:hypothetical protein
MSNRHYQQQLIHQSASLQNNYTLNVIMKSMAEEIRADADSQRGIELARILFEDVKSRE